MNNKYIYDELIRLSKKSIKSGDVPVAAIIEKDGKIVSKSYNNREKNNKVTSHAEINAILKANKKLKNKFLYDCNLFVTLKPCSMCENIIKQTRIKNVFYLLDKPENKHEYSKTIIKKIDNEYSEKYLKILQNFFNNIRQ